MKRKHKRLTFVAIAMGLLAVAVGLALMAFRENIVLFYSPTEILEKAPPPGVRLRIGGLVEKGSIKKKAGTALVQFRITDLDSSISAVYEGILPDLFREEQGVVAGGRLVNGIFIADEVLARHDENYMPPEVADALKKSDRFHYLGETLKESGPAEAEEKY